MHRGIKTKLMTNFETSETITIYDHRIEKVDNYKYLDQTLKIEETK